MLLPHCLRSEAHADAFELVLLLFILWLDWVIHWGGHQTNLVLRQSHIAVGKRIDRISTFPICRVPSLCRNYPFWLFQSYFKY